MRADFKTRARRFGPSLLFSLVGDLSGVFFPTLKRDRHVTQASVNIESLSSNKINTYLCSAVL